MDNQTILKFLNNGDFNKEVLCAAISLKGSKSAELFRLARKKRDENFPSGKVEARSVIEISNICRCNCRFCNVNYYGINGKGYTLTRGEILGITGHLYSRGRRVILLQSGENGSRKFVDMAAGCVDGIKREYPDVTIMLCLGNLSPRQYRQLKNAGAGRYVLKFETSNPRLYAKIKPGETLKKRLDCIAALKEAGFSVSSGNMTGLPGQTVEDLAEDIILTGRLGLEMASTSVFIPGELSAYRNKPKGNLTTALNYTALLRILYPNLLIPATSSLEKSGKGGQYLGLMAGANAVTIHDGTPEALKKNFPIYSTARKTPGEKFLKQAVTKAGLKF